MQEVTVPMGIYWSSFQDVLLKFDRIEIYLEYAR
jgi:hypothetical protein